MPRFFCKNDDLTEMKYSEKLTMLERKDQTDFLKNRSETEKIKGVMISALLGSAGFFIGGPVLGASFAAGGALGPKIGRYINKKIDSDLEVLKYVYQCPICKGCITRKESPSSLHGKNLMVVFNGTDNNNISSYWLYEIDENNIYG